MPQPHLPENGHALGLPMPHRSRVSGRYMPASRQLADRLDKVDLAVERAFAVLKPVLAVLDRAEDGSLGPDDVVALRDVAEVLWAALETVGEDVEEVRELVGVAHG